jgi:hypothetical protein
MAIAGAESHHYASRERPLVMALVAGIKNT